MSKRTTKVRKHKRTRPVRPGKHWVKRHSRTLGSRTDAEVRILGPAHLADIKGIGPKTTNLLAKYNIRTLEDVDRLKKDEALSRRIITNEKISEAQLEKVVAAATNEREELALEKTEQLQESREKELKKYKTPRLSKTKQKDEPPAVMMEHQMREYVEKRAAEHGLSHQADNIWDEFSSEVSWRGKSPTTVSEGWEMLYAFVREKGLETNKERFKRAQKQAEIEVERERAFTKEQYVEVLRSIKTDERQVIEELHTVAKDDPELVREIVEEVE